MTASKNYLFSLLAAFFLQHVSGVILYVNSITGNDSICRFHSNPVDAVPCQSLEHAYNMLQGTSNITVNIETDINLNNRVLHFTNLINISITGVSKDKRLVGTLHQINCKGHSGIYFEGCENIHLSYLTLSQCMQNDSGYRSAVIFRSSFDIEILNITISNCPSSGMILVDCYGKVNLKYVDFIGNGRNIGSCPPKSAGLYVEVSKFIHPGGKYTLNFCNFFSNLVYRSGCLQNEHFNSSILWSNSRRGGGMMIALAGTCKDSIFALYSCNFTNNTAKWGGGLYIQFQDSTQNNTIQVKHTTFLYNRALRESGGLNINFLNDRHFCNKTNKVQVNHVQFLSNRARFGGGVGIAVAFSNFLYSSEGNIQFLNCTWDSNTADVVSPAIDIGPYSDNNSDKYGFLPKPLFRDIQVINNYIFNITEKKLKKTRHKNSGVFLVTRMEARFTGHCIFRNNSPSALMAVSGGINLEPYTAMVFVNNNGTNGGAIALYGYSYIFLSSNTKLVFQNNRASDYGGAIYYSGIDQHELFSSFTCFFEGESSSPNNVTLEFDGNDAARGKWIYAESSLSCANSCHMKKGSLLNVISKCIGNVTESEEENIVSTSAQTFGLEEVQYNYSIIPGSKINIPFYLKDEMNQNVTQLLSITTNNISNVKFQQQYTIDGNLFPIGAINETTIVDVSAAGIRSIYFQFILQTLPCPPGFVFNNFSKTCECGQSDYEPIVSCNTTVFRAYMDKQYWAGYIPYHSNHLYFAPCLAPICNSSVSYLPSNVSELDQTVCGAYRTGIMCGKCLHNTSVHFHSRAYSCKTTKHCHLGPLLYIISEIIPVIILFVVVVVFDLSFTSGSIVGFIFFSQYLEDLTLHSSNAALELIKLPYRFYYGIFNMEYFTTDYFSFCLWKSLDTQDIIAFKYVTVVFSFSLVILLISVLRSGRCGAISKYTSYFSKKKAHIDGLSAFLVLCYIECTKTSFLLLKYVKPIGLNGRQSEVYTYYGGLPYFKGKHMVYGILAIISLIFITIVPPIILLLHPLLFQLLSLCNLSEHWLLHKILKLLHFQKVIPFLDCFQSCYKDRYRFFSGLYYVYRVTLLLCFITAVSYIELLVYLQVLLLIFLGVHSMMQPYKKKSHNILDSFILFNLSLINSLNILGSIANKGVLPFGHNVSRDFLLILQLILLYLPMVASFCWICWKLRYFCKPCRHDNRTEYEELVTNDIDDSRDGGEQANSFETTQDANISGMHCYSSY